MDLKQLAEKGQEIYERKYRADLEENHHGEFVAIDIFTEKYYLGKTSDEAVKQATSDNPSGFYHLIRIGFSGAHRMGTLSSNASYAFF
jgi:hypothetical protein